MARRRTVDETYGGMLEWSSNVTSCGRGISRGAEVVAEFALLTPDSGRLPSGYSFSPLTFSHSSPNPFTSAARSALTFSFRASGQVLPSLIAAMKFT